MNFTFVVSKPPDLTFGALKPDGSWTGMIGELINQNADMGIVFERLEAGNALVRVQRVHEAADLWDIAFCTR